MSKTLYTKHSINHETGEVLTSNKLVSKKVPREKFASCFIKDICLLARCPQSEIAIVLGCLQYLEWNTNELILNASRRKELAKEINIKDTTFKIGMSRLYQKNIFVKIETNGITKIYLNPTLFFVGDEISKLNICSITYEYKLIDKDEPDTNIFKDFENHGK
jgi:hypothetical protein